MANKKAAAPTSERTYVGPATRLRTSETAKPIGPGDKVTLSEAQYAQLSGLGHSFDPPWVAATLPTPQEAQRDSDTEETIPA